VADIAADDFLPLGTLESVVAAVCAAFPNAQWDKRTHAHLGLDKHTAMMIELGHVETSNSIHVSVSGPGNPVPDLLSFANANGWFVLDCSSSDFIDPRSIESEGFAGYRSLWMGLRGRGETSDG
jgi:hypothetical protein